MSLYEIRRTEKHDKQYKDIINKSIMCKFFKRKDSVSFLNK